MKFSLALTGLILAIGLATGWLQRQKTTVLQEQRADLVAEGRSLGISDGSPSAGSPPTRGNWKRTSGRVVTPARISSDAAGSSSPP